MVLNGPQQSLLGFTGSSCNGSKSVDDTMKAKDCPLARSGSIARIPRLSRHFFPFMPGVDCDLLGSSNARSELRVSQNRIRTSLR